MVDGDGLAGKIPKNFGKDKPINPMPTAEDMKKKQEPMDEKAGSIADFLKCLTFRNCEAEKEIERAQICIRWLCTTTCPPFVFEVDFRNESALFDPQTTTCTCLKREGLNPRYQGGPPPGLTPPGR